MKLHNTCLPFLSTFALLSNKAGAQKFLRTSSKTSSLESGAVALQQNIDEFSASVDAVASKWSNIEGFPLEMDSFYQEMVDFQASLAVDPSSLPRASFEEKVSMIEEFQRSFAIVERILSLMEASNYTLFQPFITEVKKQMVNAESLTDDVLELLGDIQSKGKDDDPESTSLQNTSIFKPGKTVRFSPKDRRLNVKSEGKFRSRSQSSFSSDEGSFNDAGSDRHWHGFQHHHQYRAWKKSHTQSMPHMKHVFHAMEDMNTGNHESLWQRTLRRNDHHKEKLHNGRRQLTTKSKLSQCELLIGCAKDMSLYDMVFYHFSDYIDVQGKFTDNFKIPAGFDILATEANIKKKLQETEKESGVSERLDICSDLLDLFHKEEATKDPNFWAWAPSSVSEVCYASGTTKKIDLYLIKKHIGAEAALRIMEETIAAAKILYESRDPLKHKDEPFIFQKPGGYQIRYPNQILGLSDLPPLKKVADRHDGWNVGGFPLGECQSDCDDDDDCDGDLVCMENDGGLIPGCAGHGKTFGNWDFCVKPIYKLRTVAADLAADAAKLKVCEADCDTDEDCEEGLICFETGDSAVPVPGCAGTSRPTWDYCIKSDGPKELHFVGADPAEKLGQCQGDCDEDSDCEGSLKCFQRENDEAVPGCSGNGHSEWDFCYGATSDRPAPVLSRPELTVDIETFYEFDYTGLWDVNKLHEMDNQRKVDALLNSTYRVFGETSAGQIAALAEVGRDEVKLTDPYCPREWFLAKNEFDPDTDENGILCLQAAEGTKKFNHVANDYVEGVFPLKECEGDCDNDDECKGNLVCSERDGNAATYGCKGNDPGDGWDFCVRPPEDRCDEDCVKDKCANSNGRFITDVGPEHALDNKHSYHGCYYGKGCPAGWSGEFTDEGLECKKTLSGACGEACARRECEDKDGHYPGEGRCNLPDTYTIERQPQLPGYCCLDTPEVSGIWGEPYTCKSQCQNYAPSLAGISEGTCQLFGGTFCPYPSDCTPLKMCVARYLKAAEALKATDPDKYNPTYISYLRDAPNITNPMDAYQCGRSREYFGYEATFPIDMKICDEIEEYQNSQDLSFMNEVLKEMGSPGSSNRVGGGSHGSNSPYLSNGKFTIIKTAKKKDLAVAEKTDSQCNADALTVWQSIKYGFELAFDITQDIYDGAAALACPGGPLGIVQTTCAITKNISLTIFLIVRSVARGVLGVTNHLLDATICGDLDPQSQGEMFEAQKALTSNIESIYEVLEERQSQSHQGLNALGQMMNAQKDMMNAQKKSMAGVEGQLKKITTTLAEMSSQQGRRHLLEDDLSFSSGTDNAEVKKQPLVSVVEAELAALKREVDEMKTGLATEIISMREDIKTELAERMKAEMSQIMRAEMSQISEMLKAALPLQTRQL